MTVYQIINLINGKSYVGQTVQPLSDRWYQHQKDTSHCRALNSAIKKYGKENFRILSLASCDSIEELNKQEQIFIRSLNSMAPNGYNLTTGGDSYERSEETKEKISKAKIGNKNPMFGKKLENSPQFGKKRTQETKLKQSKAKSRFKIKIVCHQNSKVYDSIREASRSLGIGASNICNMLKGKYKQCNGYTFERIRHDV